LSIDPTIGSYWSKSEKTVPPDTWHQLFLCRSPQCQSTPS
jgi:hypothetical protein